MSFTLLRNVRLCIFALVPRYSLSMMHRHILSLMHRYLLPEPEKNIRDETCLHFIQHMALKSSVNYTCFQVRTFWELYNCMDSVLSNPYVVRIACTLSYTVYLIYINACAYYAFSAWEGLGSNGWVFNGVGHAYIRCFYFATKTATSIGKNPKPENEYEYMFMTASWLMGVFVFALLIGQIRDIITTATYSRTEYRKLVDETLEYMRRLNLPQELQEKVKLWFTFTWQQQHRTCT